MSYCELLGIKEAMSDEEIICKLAEAKKANKKSVMIGDVEVTLKEHNGYHDSGIGE